MARATQSAEITLLRSVASGDAAAIDSLLELHGDAVVRFIHHRLAASLEDAEEIAQDTFLSAVSLAPTYDGSCSVLTWLCAIAKLRIIDFMRRRGRAKRVPFHQMVTLDDATLETLSGFDPTVSPVDTALDRMDSVGLVKAMLSGLGDDEREALLLRFVEGFTAQEVARHLGRSEKAAEHLIDRARKKAATVATEWLR